MTEKNCIILFFCSVLFSAGCAPTVLTQAVPVSTNPMGATIYANGTPVGKTPATVSLERTRDHVLTLVKDNYRQEDVVISRQYQSDKVLTNAVLSGVNSGLFFKNKQMGVASGMGSLSRQEATGEAYVLVPSAVTVSLVPLDAPAGPRTDPGGSTAGPGAVDSRASSADRNFSTGDVLTAGVVAGAAVGAAQAKPIEKTWDTSSSTKSYVQPDGTQVTKKTGTSVGVGVNPAGIVNALDQLFK